MLVLPKGAQLCTGRMTWHRDMRLQMNANDACSQSHQTYARERKKEKLSRNMLHISQDQFDEELKVAIFCSSSMMRRINSCSRALTRPLLLIVSKDIPFIFAAP